MKNLLTLALLLAAMFIAGSVNAQERIAKAETAATDTLKVKSKQDTVKTKQGKKDKGTPGKPSDKKAEKVMPPPSKGTDRMAIDELGMPVEKKDKKKKVTKSDNNSGTKQD